MLVQVTQNDIDLGTPGRCHVCPLSLAISRAAETHIGVGVCSAYQGLKEILLPRKAIEFRFAFDQQLPVQPFEFELPPLSTWCSILIKKGEHGKA